MRQKLSLAYGVQRTFEGRFSNVSLVRAGGGNGGQRNEIAMQVFASAAPLYARLHRPFVPPMEELRSQSRS